MLNAIRGLENLKAGQRYIVIHSYIQGYNVRVGKIKYAEIQNVIGDYSSWKLFFEHRSYFTSDCGVTPYRDGRYNESNYLIEDPLWRKFD
jgi:hypothetical protein